MCQINALNGTANNERMKLNAEMKRNEIEEEIK
jgi:hypothetical protein